MGTSLLGTTVDPLGLSPRSFCVVWEHTSGVDYLD